MSTQAPYYDDIPPAKLRPDVENPRFAEAGSDREAILRTLEELGPKILRLAEDIAEFGLSPLDVIGVYEDPPGEGTYVAMEGNRRVTALRMLMAPEIGEEVLSSGQMTKYKALAKRYRENPVGQVHCAVFENRDACTRWIRLRHGGEDHGRGTVAWGRPEKARFDEKHGGSPSLSRQFLSWASRSPHLSSKLKNRLDDVPTSTLDRMLTDPDFRRHIGLEMKRGRLLAQISDKQLARGAKKVLGDLIAGMPVGDVYNKAARATYAKTFDATERPSHHAPKGGWRDVDSGEPSGGNNPPPKPPAPPPPRPRTYLIKKDCSLTIPITRIARIYHELKDKVAVARASNAVSVLFRVFLELSVDHYLVSNGLMSQTKVENPSTKLRVKITAVADHLEDSGRWSKAELKPVRRVSSGEDGAHALDTFHGYVHNPALDPVPHDLLVAWDNLQAFFEELWKP